MTNLTIRKIDWLAELVFGFNILIILTLATSLGSILARSLGFDSNSTLVWLGTISLVYGLRYLALPLGLLNIILVTFFLPGRPGRLKYTGLFTGICGTLAGLALWVLILLAL